MDYFKLELLKECLTEFYKVFEITKDTADYVPKSLNNRIYKKIFKEEKRAFRRLDKISRRYFYDKWKEERQERREVKRAEREARREAKRLAKEGKNSET